MLPPPNLHTLFLTLFGLLNFQVFSPTFSLATATYIHREQIPPGTTCDNSPWTELIAPVSIALRQLYLSMGTKREKSARQEFTQITRNIFDSKLNQALGLSREELANKQLLHIERMRLLDQMCDGVHAAFLYCNAEGRCACKAEFPFEYSTVHGNCLGRLGSICAIGEDFRVGCADGVFCERGADNTTYFCGGNQEFENRRVMENSAASLISQVSMLIVFPTTLLVSIYFILSKI